MNLLSLIIIFLALVIAGSIAFIAWELTSEKIMPRGTKNERRGTSEKIMPHGTKNERSSTTRQVMPRSEEGEPGDSKESKESPGPKEQP